MMLSYRLLVLLLTPALLLYFIWLALRNKQPRYLWQHLGFQLGDLPKNSLWIHCASVGESITAMPLVKEILHQHPSLKIIITTNTVTGAKIIQQQAIPNLFHCYLPFDWRFSVNRFLQQLSPVSLLVVETEIWPNLFAQCNKHHCPVNIINARLSIKTTEANIWVRSLLKTALQYTKNIYTRSALDKAAYIKLGAGKKNIHVIGNLKYSTKPLDASKPISIKRDYILLASTHDDEEVRLAQCFQALKRDELLVLAPRHPERCPAVIRSLKKAWSSLKIVRHSFNESIDNDTDIYLLDTVGELMNFFPQAKLVIMGGSFVNIGGHNILEPAQFGRAIICGPFMGNFKEETDLLLEKHALLQVQSFDALETCLQDLFNDDNKIQILEKNAQEISKTFNHIASDYANIITKLLEDKSM